MKRKLSISFISLIVITVFGISCNTSPQNNSNQTINDNNQEPNEAPKSEEILTDTYITSQGNLDVYLVGHGSVMFQYKGKTIHVDPYSKVADYSLLPKADLVILTHEHPDHLDIAAIDAVKKDSTHFIMTQVCNDSLRYGEVLQNRDKTNFEDISIEAVPAYNIEHKRQNGELYHPKGRGNGYIFTFGDKKVYVAGDTENIPEMKDLNDIYVAFLPKNTPYTMTDDMFIDAARTVNPTYLYPYHFSEFNEKTIGKALQDTKIKILVRPMSHK